MVETIEPEGVEIKEQPDEPPVEPAAPESAPQSTIAKQKFITDYLSCLQAVCQYDKLNLPPLNPLLPFLYLDTGMTIKVKPLTKQQFIDLVRPENEDLAFVMETIDLGDDITNEITINRSFTWRNAFPEYINLLRENYQGIAFSQVSHLEELTDNNVFIPNLTCLSYFMEQGPSLRKYLPHAPESATFYYYKGINHPSGRGMICTRKDITNDLLNIFTAASIRKYSEQTGQTTIKALMDELKATFVALDVQQPRFDFYARLKQYNPDLTKR